MKDHSKKYFSDVLIAIAFIEDFIKDIQNYQQYCEDFKTQSAVERQLVIIGEALNQLKKKDPTVIISHDQSIISFRNRLVHAYDGIDNAIVWAILKNHLQQLKAEIIVLKDLTTDSENQG
ncbi:MAG: hypothetical protein RLZZ205_654 [Bacteroidota bacterium]